MGKREVKEKTLEEKVEETKERFKPKPKLDNVWTMGTCLSTLTYTGTITVATSAGDFLSGVEPAPPEPPKIPDWLKEKMKEVHDKNRTGDGS